MRYHRSLISQPPKGLVSHWRFDGNVLDSVGNNDGTIYGDPQFVRAVHGHALGLGGVDDYVGVAKSAVNVHTTNDFAISAWIIATDNGTDYFLVTSLGGNRRRFDPPDGPTYVLAVIHSTYHTNRSARTTLDYQWHHV